MDVCYRYGEKTVRCKERPIYLKKFSVSFLFERLGFFFMRRVFCNFQLISVCGTVKFIENGHLHTFLKGPCLV